MVLAICLQKKLRRNASIELLRAPRAALSPYRPRSTARRGAHSSWQWLSTTNRARSVVGPRLRRTASASVSPLATSFLRRLPLMPRPVDSRGALRRGGLRTVHLPRAYLGTAWRRRSASLAFSRHLGDRATVPAVVWLATERTEPSRPGQAYLARPRGAAGCALLPRPLCSEEGDRTPPPAAS